jgi:hypothetical protein
VANCRTCGRDEQFEIPREHRNPMHRQGVRAYMETLRVQMSRRHRRTTGCKSSSFTVRVDLVPPVLVRATEPGERRNRT